MAPYRRKKPDPTDLSTDEEDMFTYDVEEDELEQHPDLVQKDGEKYWKVPYFFNTLSTFQYARHPLVPLSRPLGRRTPQFEKRCPKEKTTQRDVFKRSKLFRTSISRTVTLAECSKAVVFKISRQEAESKRPACGHQRRLKVRSANRIAKVIQSNRRATMLQTPANVRTSLKELLVAHHTV
ncbi:hypothetical protein TNCV_4240821 [Trichonephila clavipes]|nr:hypothetical protein TNCV_4240821 [Trichonephila clavipes]